MKIFEFCIIASGLDPEAEDFADRFFEAGCEDATIAFQKGCIVAEFAREAASIEDAIVSAVDCVIAAGARVERIEPDPLVSLSDIATRAGMSRAAMTQYSKGQRGKSFPAPVARVTSESPLWDWSSVAKWLFHHNKLPRSEAVEAEAFKAVNSALPAFGPKWREKLRAGLKAYDRSLDKVA